MARALVVSSGEVRVPGGLKLATLSLHFLSQQADDTIDPSCPPAIKPSLHTSGLAHPLTQLRSRGKSDSSIRVIRDLKLTGLPALPIVETEGLETSLRPFLLSPGRPRPYSQLRP